MRVLNVLSIAMLGLLLGSQSLAAASFSYQGQIIKPDGLALEAPNVQFTIEVRSPAPNSCLLYRERHTRNMSASNGIYALPVGDGTRLPSADPADTISLSAALNKSAGPMAGLSCASGNSYTPDADDDYELRVIFNDGTGPNVVAQNHVLRSVPYAMSAQSLNGLEAADLLQVNEDPGLALSQANLESVFTDTNYPELMALLNGTSTQYLSAMPGAPFSMNSQRITDLANPTAATDAANKNYVDSYIGGSVANGAVLSTLGAGQAGQVLTWDGNEWTVSTPSMIDATKLPLAGGTMAGAIDMNGNNLLNAGAVGSGSVTTTGAVSVGSALSVTGNSSMTGDLSVSGQTSLDQDLLVSGGIGVTNGISSDNYIILNDENELRFGDSGANYVGFKGPAAAAGAIIWELPGSDGSAGQVLATDGFGQLSWIDPSLAAPVSSVYGRTGAVVAQAGDYSAAQVSNAPAGNIGSTTVQAAINELDTEKASVTALSALDTRVGTTETNITGLSTDLAATDAAVAGLDTRLDTAETDIDNLETSVTGLTNDLATTNTNVTNLDNAKVNRAGDTMTGALNLDNQQQLQLSEADGSGANFVALRAAASLAGNTVWTLPLADGGAGEVLSTDGAGNLSFIAIPSAPVSSVYGRTGAVVAQAGDYNAGQVTSTPVGDLSATDVQAALTELDSEKASVASLAATDTAVAALDTRLDSAETNISTLTTDLAATDAAVTALDGRVSANETAITALGGRMTSAEAELVAQDGRLDTAETDIDGLDTRLTLAEGNLANLGTDYTALESRVDTAETDINALETSVNGLTTDLATTNTNVTNLTTSKVNRAGDTMTGALQMNAQTELRLADSDSSNYVGLRAPAAIGANYVFTLPTTDGDAGQVLETDGNGVLTWKSLDAVGETNVGQNLGGGTPIYAGKSGTTLQFRSLSASSAKISLDAGNPDEIGIDVDEAELDSSLIPNTPAGTIAAASVQGAINELDADKVAKAGDVMSGSLTLANQNELRLGDGDTNYVGFVAPASVGTNMIWELPAVDGLGGQVLATDGLGSLYWVNPTAAAPVDSVFGRTGVVVAESGDYSAAQITNTPAGNISATEVQSALNELDSEKVGSTRQVIAGAGLLNGGALSSDVTLNVGAGAGIAVSADSIALDISGTPDKATSAVGADSLLIRDSQDGGALKEITRANFVLSEAEVDSFVSNNGYATSTDLTTLTGRVTTAEGEIVSLDGRLDTAETDIAALETSVTALGTDKVAKAGDAMTGPLTLNATNEMRFADGDSNNYVGFAAPALVTTNRIWTLPNGDGTPGQVLSTDGSGVLNWTTPSAGGGALNDLSDAITDGTAESIYIGSGTGTGSASTHQYNLALGHNALRSMNNANADRNTAIGWEAMRYLSSGANNTALGSEAMQVLSTGNGNVGLGREAMGRLTTGSDNVSVGTTTLFEITGESNNTAVGSWSGVFLNGNENVMIGRGAMQSGGAYVGDADRNTAVGTYSLQWVTSGDANVSLGQENLRNLTTGSSNIAIGSFSGGALTTGSNNILLGYNINVPAASTANYMSLGNLIFSTGVNGTGTTLSTGNVGIGTNAPAERLDVAGSVLAGPKGTAAGQTGAIMMRELAANGTNTFTLRAPDSLAADRIWTLPDSNGTAGQVLSTNGSGVLSWINSATGTGDFMASGSVPMTGNLQLNNNWLSNDGGAEGIRITNTGQVGVGTDTPSVGFHYVGSVNMTEFDWGDAIFRAQANNNSTGNALFLGVAGTGASQRTGRMRVGLTDMVVGTGADNGSIPLHLRTNDQNRVSILVGGNVGIGNGDPGTLLDVAGAITSRPFGTGAGQGGQILLRELAANGTNTFTLRAPDSLSTNRGWILPDSDGSNGQVLQTDGLGGLSWATPATTSAAGTADGQIQFKSGTSFAADSLLHWDNTNKRLGIGQASPQHRLHTSAYSTATSGTTNTGVQMNYGVGPSSASTGIYRGLNSYVYYDGSVNSPSATMRAGYMIGTNSTTQTVGTIDGLVSEAENESTGTVNSARGVFGSVRNAVAGGTIGNAFGGLFLIERPAGTITNGYGVYIDTVNATNKWGLYQADTTARNYFGGNVAIGKTVPATALDVVGDIQYTGTLTDVSDRRLKENIQPLGSASERMREVATYSYTMKDDAQKRTEFGVMAQDLEDIFPELVQTIDQDKGYKGVNYIGLIPWLIKYVQELEEKVERSCQAEGVGQGREIASLKKENQDLKNEVKQLNQKQKELEAKLAAILKGLQK